MKIKEIIIVYSDKRKIEERINELFVQFIDLYKAKEILERKFEELLKENEDLN